MNASDWAVDGPGVVGGNGGLVCPLAGWLIGESVSALDWKESLVSGAEKIPSLDNAMTYWRAVELY